MRILKLGRASNLPSVKKFVTVSASTGDPVEAECKSVATSPD